ncbi:hypothetical protein Nepgr_028245 [Nepenthes gracilis]|uniref:Uncharacterized protein n=1 Tax=Nepenthes gracilis TaxID=150966 RepID=A0AAD3TDB1_NEPGR|nr:hypothetical protein Nepgr_028245 [Nepenthes gracilis]
MWQVAVTAVVVGSGLLAERLFTSTAGSRSAQSRSPQTKEIEINRELQSPNNSNKSQLSPSLPNDHFEVHSPVDDDAERIFRFSSSGSGDPSARLGSKKLRIVGKNLGRVKKNLGLFNGESGDRRKISGKKVHACLKKRKTSKNADGKRESSCSNDGSSFSWGLGLGIMYMMSAGKAEISKLNGVVDETAKVVQELKSELYKRKSSSPRPLSRSLMNHTDRDKNEHEQNTEQANIDSSGLKEDRIDLKVLSPMIDDFDYASSVMTEEPQPHSSEMDQLEAELESELQKLPWCTAEGSCNRENKTDYGKVKGSCEPEQESSTSSRFSGVSPLTLNRKLSCVLIKQQEGQITELETELNLAYSKLQEKEAELHALKDCINRLSEVSLSADSDEDTKGCGEEGSMGQWDRVEKTGPKPKVLGTKRAMNFGYSHY